MFLINKVILGGRIASDITLQYTQSGLAVCNLNLAVSKKLKDGTWESSFIGVKLFGKTAELVNQYLTKGSALYVEGEIKQERWEKDGKKDSKTIVLAENVKFEIQKKEGQGTQSQKPQTQAQAQAPKEAPKPKQVDTGIPEIQIEDDEIPF